jgi:hypothetical protein
MRKKPVGNEQDAREDFAAAARALWPAAKGSLAQVSRPCGRPQRCAACRSGRKHPMWIFTFRQGGRLRCRYVAADMVEPLHRALANGRKLEKRLVDEGAALIDRYRRERALREACR